MDEITRRVIMHIAIGIVLVAVGLFGVSVPRVLAGVTPVFDLSQLDRSPFPSDRFTVPDADQKTGLRVNLPRPDCAVRPSDCRDIDLLNELDGFNVQPRISIPFSGPIDVGSVDSQSIFLTSLGSTSPPGRAGGRVVGIDQIVWDGEAN